MSFFSQLLDALSILFGGSSPEAQQRQDLRAIEQKFKAAGNSLYKNHLAQPNMAEAFRVLSECSRSIEPVLSQTLFSTDAKISQHYSELLIMTGFTQKSLELLEKNTYEARRAEFSEDPDDKHLLDRQRHNLDYILKEMNTATFLQIERTLQNLVMLYDLCRFSYISVLHEFNSEYSTIAYNASPSSFPFYCIPLNQLDSSLQDFYFLTANLSITASEGRALCALYAHASGGGNKEGEAQLMQSLRKTSSILRHILTPEIVLDLLRLAKSDPHLEAKAAISRQQFLEGFRAKLRAQFENNSKRIATEVQDEKITQETQELFENAKLEQLSGYNQVSSTVFTDAGASSFLWILPLDIIKTFLKVYLPIPVRTFLNDVVVEGYFNAPEYKSAFSNAVFTSLDVDKQIEAFEQTFAKGGKFDISVMQGYIRDSMADATFMQTLDHTINDANMTAKTLIQNTTTTLYKMYGFLQDVIPDAKKATPEFIANIKGFFTSSRNRDNAEFVESSLPKWDIFFDVMRNYAIIGDKRDE